MGLKELSATSFLIIVLCAQISTAQLNFHDEDYLGQTADTYNWLEHPCRRKCSETTAPQTCQYVFVVEIYFTLSKACHNCPSNITDCSRPHCVAADGVGKPIYVVNRQMPGPLIEVCLNDTIVVDVRNRMLSDSTSIHWHGFNQRGTPYMDGVPMVTQCPILPGENFQYKFKATIPGSYFYHSHSGNQRSDGLFGQMVVNKLVEDKQLANLYDHDEIRIAINDWTHSPGDAYFTEIYHKGTVLPSNILINGMGRYNNDSEVTNTPLATFEVTKGSKHRIRVVHAGFDDCPVVMTIDNHPLLLISLDSNDIQPVEVDAITLWPGERADLVVNANQTVDNYWIRVNGDNLCRKDGRKNATDGEHQVAILRYVGAPLTDPIAPVAYGIPSVNERRVLNPFNLGTENDTKGNIQIPDLTALSPNDATLREVPDHQVYINFNFQFNISNYNYQRKGLYDHDPNGITPQFNHITLKPPPVPLLSQWGMVKPSTLCNETNPPDGMTCSEQTEQCACTHVINLPINSVIELVLVAEGPAERFVSNHPLHLHGHFYRVVASRKLEGNVTVEQVKQLDKEGKIERRLDHAPWKDTMKSPVGGYTIVRFFTDNPGYWLFHCHFEPHMNIGMALIFKAGEPKDFPPVPDKFPTCGNYNDDHY